MARRLYIGKLPPDARSDEVTAMFEKFGKIVDVRLMTGFGFVEYESGRDAEDAVNDLNGKTLGSSNILVEYAKEAKSRRNDYDAPDRSYAPRRRPAGVRLTVEGLSRDTSWQDLKDFGREAGDVSFADIDREVEGRGVLEYSSRDAAERAIKQLDRKEIRGREVTVTLADDRAGGPDNYRRDDYRDRYRDSRDRYDRGGGYDRDRGYDRGHDRGFERRRRSVSPGGRRDDRAKSPRRDKDYDREKEYGRDRDYEDKGRRDRAEPYEDRRREDRRRDDRDRYEDKA